MKKEVMNIIEKRSLWIGDLRRFCVKEKLYTRGRDEDYGNLFDYIDSKNQTKRGLATKDIIYIAEDIKKHSDTEYEITNLSIGYVWAI